VQRPVAQCVPGGQAIVAEHVLPQPAGGDGSAQRSSLGLGEAQHPASGAPKAKSKSPHEPARCVIVIERS